LDDVTEVLVPEVADAIVMEERGSFKDFRYINKLIGDPFISRYADRIFTINTDDCATGVLRGVYTSLPKSRIDHTIHRSVPFMHFPNELVFLKRKSEWCPHYLASWRGNPMSNSIRRRMVPLFRNSKEFLIQDTVSWLDHSIGEKQRYVDLILDGKFSLCPAGWAPVTYRIYESMALGRCPVILADEFAPPEGPEWKKFALFYPQRKVDNLMTYLRSHEFRSQGLGREAQVAWELFFSGEKMVNYYVNTLHNLMRSAPATSKEAELRRWTSLRMYWLNHWTLPQRMINKARKLSRVLVSKVVLS
jgi:hypothetical protein